MSNLQNAKTMLTKLLASENLTVQYMNVPTASFDLAKRVVTLPLWKDMSPALYDLMGGHEVGHALFTTAEGWHNALTSNVDRKFKTFLNVVEDARIERKIKDKFPGIRKSFNIGYRELIQKDFFGIQNLDVNTLLLIDRLNIHFKCGVGHGIEFSDDESKFIKMMNETETWDDVVAVATAIYEYCKKELEEKLQKDEELEELLSQKFDMSMSEEDSDEFEYEYDSPKGVMENGPNSSSDNMDEEIEDKLDQKSSGSRHYSKESSVLEEMLRSITDETFQDRVKSLSEPKDVLNATVPSMKSYDSREFLVEWKALNGKLADREHSAYKTNVLSQFESKNKAAVDYLVKEFEMRKKAAELRRVSISDTGTIDTNLLHSYKFDDNIFRKIASVAEGKNHGIFILVDWSGSMADNMKGTIEQMLVLTMFCRRANIPFEVCCFSTEYTEKRTGKTNKSFTASIQASDLRIYENKFKLLNLLSSTMPNQTYRNFAIDLLNMADSFGSYRSHYGIVSDDLGLGGTPLNESLIILPKLINEFRANRKLEVVTTVILTDGDDSSYMFRQDNAQLGPESRRKTSIIFDPDTKQSHKIDANGITKTLLQILKSRTGCNLVGFFLLQPKKSAFESAYEKNNPGSGLRVREEAYAKYKEEKVYAIDTAGYDEYYLIPGGNQLEVDNDSLNDIIGESKVTTRKLKGVFLKMNQRRLDSRILLKKFIEKVS